MTSRAKLEMLNPAKANRLGLDSCVFGPIQASGTYQSQTWSHEETAQGADPN